MTETTQPTDEAMAKLRAAFPPEVIGKLPKGGAQLDFVGHADVTDRLLTVDPAWNWEPVAYALDGSPLITATDKGLTMWIRLTICGVTRLGVGTCETRKFEPEKELIGDAIRNAAMRFGVALDLWSKNDRLESQIPDTITKDQAQYLFQMVTSIEDKTAQDEAKRQFRAKYPDGSANIPTDQFDTAKAFLNDLIDQAALSEEVAA